MSDYMPTISPSGTGRKHLIARQKEVLAAVSLLVSELRRAAPARRDYKHLNDEEYGATVLSAHRARINAALSIQAEHEAILKSLGYERDSF